jgi:hypothetical protein
VSEPPGYPNQPPRPAERGSPPREPQPDPQVNASALAYAARDAVQEVLPAEWHCLPDGRNTASLLAGTLANHYADQQQAQAERLAVAALEDVDDYG